MSKRLKTGALLLALCSPPVAAQFCDYSFTNAPVCTGERCSVLIRFQPGGEARLLPDPVFGPEPAIGFAAESTFDLGTGGQMNFGDAGGVQATYGALGLIADCDGRSPGSRSYSVNFANGGWFELSANNLMTFGENNVFTLVSGSVIDGRLLLISDGTVALSTQGGDAALANVNIAAAGVTVSGQGEIELGEVGAGEGDITIDNEGAVNIASISDGGAVNIDSLSDITIGTIGSVQTVDLAVNSTDGGTITVGDFQVSESTGPVGVTCNTALECEDFVPGEDDGSGGGNGDEGDPGASDDNCDDPDRDPDAPNACVAGGAVSPWWLLVLWIAAGAGVFRRPAYARGPVR